MNSTLLFTRFAGLMIFFAGSTSAWPQTLADPTRPPPAMAEPPSSQESLPPPVLQSIIITSTARAALIGGQRIELGGAYNGARLIEINETQVTLRYPDRVEVLKMYPDVSIKPVAQVGQRPREPRRSRN